ncbi:MAG: 50S ribosomal protein L1 [Pseudomonadota bacterium]
MVALAKRIKAIREKIEVGKSYKIDESLSLLKELSKVKFDETIDVAVNLGVDPRKSDQVVRGATVLPHGTGRKVTVAVFAQGKQAEEAKQAGADIVGFEDLAEEVKAGNINFSIVIATPDSMRVVGTLGPILGPRGLMPNPKTGTVSADVVTAVKNAKAGQIQFRTDKNGIIHCPIGKVSFSTEHLIANLNAILNDLRKAKPSSAKGVYIKKISVSSTMGPGLTVDLSSVSS